MHLALRAFAFGAAINIGFAVFDAASGLNVLYRPEFGTRLNGLNGEPRALGRVCALALLVPLLTGRSILGKYTALWGMLLVLGIGISGSTSAMFALAVTITILFVVRAGGKSLARGFAVLATALAATAPLVYFGAAQFDTFVAPRVENIIEAEDREPGEPAIVAALEVFDRAAARFLLANPQYLLVGTGPDLISLPASRHISERASRIYGEQIDSVPHTGLLAIISRTGIPGLFLWALAVGRIARSLGRSRERVDKVVMELLLSVAAFSAFVLTPAFYLVIGIGLGRVLAKSPSRFPVLSGSSVPLRRLGRPVRGISHDHPNDVRRRSASVTIRHANTR
ncbi:MAG: hypothetical protein U1E22_05495, partial [Coriobacteriia bacterium]|nr:hypothetical protein [Coriobacteriia bacterium]